MRNKIKQQNPYLIVGIIMTFSLIIIAIFGEYLAPHDLDNAPKIRVDPVTNEITSAPFAPSRENWLGTDEGGIDLLSKLFHGAKYTLGVVFVISFSRIIIALPLGLIGGWWSKYFKTPFSYINRAWSSIPLFLFVYIIIAPITSLPFLDIKFRIFILWLVLTIAGIPPLMETIRGHVERIKDYEFMDGVKILGASPFYTIRKHMLPHIRPHLVVILSMEMSQILWLLGQLGIFHVFVGGTIEIYSFEHGWQFNSMTNEWAGLLGYGKRYFLAAPWIVFAPALAFVYGILGFQFLAEGLRRKLNKNQIKYDYDF